MLATPALGKGLLDLTELLGVIGPLRNAPELCEVFEIEEGDGMWLPEEERAKTDKPADS